VPKDVLGTPILAQFSSCGKLTEKWLHEFVVSCAHHGETTFPEVQLVWPSTEFVRTCIDGYQAGGAICMPHKNLNQVVRTRLHHYRSSHPAHAHIPPHIKCYTRVGRHGCMPWYCLTSANMSSAAWGALQKKDTQLFIRHFEMGVLFLPQLSACRFSYSAQHSNRASAFSLPYLYPPAQYVDEEPWDFQSARFQPDVHGRVFGGSG
jgi:tyrosyl-DNA phosphodiesterase 1